MLVRQGERDLRVLVEGDVVARHDRAVGRGRTVTDPLRDPPTKRLGSMAQVLEAQNVESLGQGHSYREYLEALVDGELGSRANKSLMKRIKAARFPVSKTLAEFDFDFQPKLDVELVKTLAITAS